MFCTKKKVHIVQSEYVYVYTHTHKNCCMLDKAG